MISVIHIIYEKVKSFFLSGIDSSGFFGSSFGVRQGENLAPILLSLF